MNIRTPFLAILASGIAAGCTGPEEELSPPIDGDRAQVEGVIAQRLDAWPADARCTAVAEAGEWRSLAVGPGQITMFTGGNLLAVENLVYLRRDTGWLLWHDSSFWQVKARTTELVLDEGSRDLFDLVSSVRGLRWNSEIVVDDRQASLTLDYDLDSETLTYELRQAGEETVQLSASCALDDILRQH